MDISPFLQTHPLDNASPTGIAVSEKSEIDTELKSFLILTGINSFSNGFLRTLSPDHLLDLFPVWKWAEKGSTFIFMRTAFSGLFYKKKANYYFFDPLFGDRINLGNDLSFLLNVALCDEQSLNSTFLFNIYKKAVKMKRVPEKEECFAFVPALKLGGPKDAEHLEIVKLKEHLLFLSQL